MASQEIHAAGAVVWRTRGGAVEVAVVHRPRYDDWSLPKGKLDPGESPRAAAWREVCEETGAHVALGRFLTRTRYRVRMDRKVVDYFAARYVSGSFEPSDEVDQVRWLSLSEASSSVSYDHDRAVLAAFAAMPAALTTLLLVRHAKAGSRAEWQDVDELRPLSRGGRKQVASIRELARMYAPDRVFSAPLVRCVQTVDPVAADADVPVHEEELLSEKAYNGMEDAAVRLLMEIVADGGVPVVCSQGGVIPDLVTRVAKSAKLPLDNPVTAKKGSVWVLFFAENRLVAADYIEQP